MFICHAIFDQPATRKFCFEVKKIGNQNLVLSDDDDDDDG
jgi:hypothetical protein